MRLLIVFLSDQILSLMCHRIALLTEVDGGLVREITVVCWELSGYYFHGWLSQHLFLLFKKSLNR